MIHHLILISVFSVAPCTFQLFTITPVYHTPLILRPNQECHYQAFAVAEGSLALFDWVLVSFGPSLNLRCDCWRKKTDLFTLFGISHRFRFRYLCICRNHFSLTGHFVSFNFGTDRPGHCTQMETNRTGRGQSVPHPDTVLHTRAHAPRGTFSFLTHNSGLVHFVGWAGAS